MAKQAYAVTLRTSAFHFAGRSEFRHGMPASMLIE